VNLFTQNPALKEDSFSGRKYTKVDVCARRMKVSSCCLQLLEPHVTDSTNSYRCYYIKTGKGFLRKETQIMVVTMWPSVSSELSYT